MEAGELPLINAVVAANGTPLWSTRSYPAREGRPDAELPLLVRGRHYMTRSKVGRAGADPVRTGPTYSGSEGVRALKSYPRLRGADRFNYALADVLRELPRSCGADKHLDFRRFYERELPPLARGRPVPCSR